MLSEAQAKDTSSAIQRWNTDATTISSFSSTHTTRTRKSRSLERGAVGGAWNPDSPPPAQLTPRQAHRNVAARVAERKMSVDGGTHSP